MQESSSATPSAASAVEAVREKSAPSTQPETVKSEPQSSDQPAPNLEVFARKEQQFREKERRWQQERQQWEQEKSNYISKTRFNEDPLGALEEVGLTYEKLTELTLNSPNASDPTIRALRAELRQLKDELNNGKKQSQEQVTAQYEQAVNQMRTDVKALVGASEEFETIKMAGDEGVEAIVELIKQTFENEGYVMDMKQAAAEMEKYYVEEAFKFAQTKKVQERLKPAAPASEAPKTSQPQNQPIKTLTNQVTANQSTARLSEKERMARAIAAFNGQLK